MDTSLFNIYKEQGLKMCMGIIYKKKPWILHSVISIRNRDQKCPGMIVKRKPTLHSVIFNKEEGSECT